jgi:hypothetical protein
MARSNPGVEDKGRLNSDNRPDAIVERLQNIGRIAADVVHGRAAIVVAVAD